eukprot:SAG31_NODE_11490_length_1024_cov_10.925405_2_plen_116_part_00
MDDDLYEDDGGPGDDLVPSDSNAVTIDEFNECIARAAEKMEGVDANHTTEYGTMPPSALHCLTRSENCSRLWFCTNRQDFARICEDFILKQVLPELHESLLTSEIQKKILAHYLT